MPDRPGFFTRLIRRTRRIQRQQRIAGIASQVAANAPAAKLGQPPVIFFNASARLGGFSQNAAFSLLTGWGVRLSGLPVKNFVCQVGMTHCVLGTNQARLDQPPPCETCISQSKRLYAHSDIHWFGYLEDAELARKLDNLTIDQLSSFESSISLGGACPEIPFGRLILPSIRWALRRHNLSDDEATRHLFREYILSAGSIACQFAGLLIESQPELVVIFNGILYPEAIARWVTRHLGIRSAAFEVGFQQYSVFFSEGDPTAYPINIPDEFELSAEQNARLDVLLERRFQGQFTMAGIRFWPEMKGLDAEFLKKAAKFRQVVPVFTNVVYDTSQIHANTIFSNMFEWLDQILKIIRDNPGTLFVIRAHPDEKRPHSRKVSNETVEDWVYANQVHTMENVVFIDPNEFISSYELIQRSKFVLVYNSSIGLESILMGIPVICGGRARYTQYPTVFLPGSPGEFIELVNSFLGAAKIEIPVEFRRNARRFLYYQFFRVSIPLDAYLMEGEKQGFVSLKPFDWQQLLPENSPSMQLLIDGLLNKKTFILPFHYPNDR